MKQVVDSKICPLCGKSNSCMAGTDEKCWCLDVKVAAELLELVSDDMKNKACICLNCITSFNKNPHEFKNKLSAGKSEMK